MRIPQTAERIKEAPAQALRAVFAGVGQVLLITERVRRRGGGDERTAAAEGVVAEGVVAEGVAAEAPVAERADEAVQVPGPRDGSADAPEVVTPAAGTGSATAVGTGGAGSSAGSEAKPTAKARTAKTSTAKTSRAKAGGAKAGATKASAAETSAAKTSTSKAAGESTPGLPVPHYSELTIASLRARLRGFDIGQVRELLSYERAHEDRANVIAMFERRIAKLEEEANGTGGAAG